MRQKMKKDGQAWNCYGARTNEFLLLYYGFAFQNNLYDSFKLKMVFNGTSAQESDSSKQMYFSPNSIHPEKGFVDIFLKQNQINMKMMQYLRLTLRKSPQIYITRPSDINFEK